VSTPPSPLDLNCDLAEGELAAHTLDLLRLVTSANIACAGHAGSPEAMRLAINHGHGLGVRLGAHPGLPGNFGRHPEGPINEETLRAVLDDQIGRFLDIARSAGAHLHHVKLHGALYHATESSPDLRRTFIQWMNHHLPHTTLYALAHGRTVADARLAGLTAWDEAFADRAYLANGSLVPRSHPLAVIHDPATVTTRIHHLANHQPITTLENTPLLLRPHTACLHGDSPNALRLLQAARAALHK